MQKVISPLLQTCLWIFGYLYATCDASLAQVSSDGTVNTQVSQNGNVANITGGETRVNNLFHSFQDFSVETGNQAFFDNAPNIENIFSRVTGGNISQIDGLIRANGSASLYLINPAGIIFGENASLDIGGSFFGSASNSILFEEGEFSATDLDNPPLLTINAPIGLNLRNNSADIINLSQYEEESSDSSNQVGLKVKEGESITFKAGNIRFDGGLATAPEGSINLEATDNIEISGLATAPEGSINLEATDNIEISGLATAPEGSINLEATGNIEISGLATAPGGSINLEATGNIEIIGDEQVNFFIREESLNTSSSEGNGGAINLISTGGNITISDANLSSASTSNSENDSGGNIMINAPEFTNLTNSFIDSSTDSSTGEGGNVIISAGSSIRLEDTRIDATNFGDGQSGDVTITAFDQGSIELMGTEVEQLDIFIDSDDVLDEATAVIFIDAFGGEGSGESQTGGELTINGGSIKIDNYNLISRVNEFSNDDFDLNPNLNTQGNAGDISITGDSVAINNGSLVTGTLGDGDAGNIELNATNDIILSNGTSLSTRTVSFGSAGTIQIKANSLTLDNSSIKASNEASNLPLESNSASGELEVFAGNINLDLAENLILQDDSTISAEASGDANGGNIDIGAKFIVAFPAKNTGSDIIANADEGQGGVINIEAESIFGIQENNPLVPFSNDINASSNVDGLDGTVSITTSNVDAIQQAVELPSNVIDVNELAARTCSSDGAQASTLTVKNTARNPPSIQPFSSENIYLNGKIVFSPATLEDNSITDEHNNKIVPAQGVVVKEDGQIALVSYPTPDTVSSSVYEPINCQK